MSADWHDIDEMVERDLAAWRKPVRLTRHLSDYWPLLALVASYAASLYFGF